MNGSNLIEAKINQRRLPRNLSELLEKSWGEACENVTSYHHIVSRLMPASQLISSRCSEHVAGWHGARSPSSLSLADFDILKIQSSKFICWFGVSVKSN